MVEDEPANLEILRIDFHEQFLEIRLSLRSHPNDFGSRNERLRGQELEFRKFIAQIGPAHQEHQWYPIIERVLHCFPVHLLIGRHVEIHCFPVRHE